MNTIVISAVNLVSGGPLSILRDCLVGIESLSSNYKVVVLVNNKNLVSDITGNFEYIEFPEAKKSWFKRIYYEYYYFKKLSKKLNPILWLSLHDISPNVKAKNTAVYCHNPSPFYKVKLNEFMLDPKFTVFTYFYKYLYRINIKSNDYLIVQQEWIRKEFSKMYQIKEEKIIVAKPNIEVDFKSLPPEKESTKKTYIYPAFPRSFKNIECICEAFKNIDNNSSEVLLTISGNENKYAKRIYEKYKDVKGVHFIGLQSREKIFELYNEVGGLIFPSKLETWGLPMSEFSLTGKKIFAAGLPYAKEVLNNYPKVAYFDPYNPKELANLLISDDSNIKYERTNKFIAEPQTDQWLDLFNMLIN